MNNQAKNELNGQKVWTRFVSYGFIGGFAIGILVGVLVSGPNFHTWPGKTSILVILGCAVVGGLIGYFAPSYAAGSTAGGVDLDASSSDNGHASSGDGGGGGGD